MSAGLSAKEPSKALLEEARLGRGSLLVTRSRLDYTGIHTATHSEGHHDRSQRFHQLQ